MKLVNLARMTSPTVGTGTLTLGIAVDGCLSFADAGLENGDLVSYGISDGVNSEVGRGTYASGTLSRDTVLNSTNGGAKISCSGTQQIYITVLAEDLAIVNTVTNRQGYEAGNSWFSSGTTNYSVTGAKIQVGSINVSSLGPVTVTFPIAFSDKPVLFIMGNAMGQGDLIHWNILTAESFQVGILDSSVNWKNGFVFWLAIGPG